MARNANLPEPVGLGHTHRHESPWMMVAPLIVLATLAVVAGFLVNPLFDVGPINKHAFATFVTERNESVFSVDQHGDVPAGAEESHLPDAVHAGAEPDTGSGCFFSDGRRWNPARLRHVHHRSSVSRRDGQALKRDLFSPVG
ncbi:MAG: hypothetical protein O3C69_03370 [Chloroflexi bacterium]|nr:hypothetical protein [Chloroflexota bacterium]